MFYSPDIVCDLVCFVLCFACHSAVCFFSSVSRSIFGFLCSSNSFSDRIKWLLSIILFCFLSHDLMLKRIESVLASIISRAYEQNAYILFLIVRCTNAFPMVFLTRADALVSVCIFYHFIVVVFFVGIAQWECKCMDDSIDWQMNDNDENLNTFQESIMMWGINVYNFLSLSVSQYLARSPCPPSFHAIPSTHCR